MIAGNQINLAAEQPRLGLRRAVTILPVNFDTDLLPKTRLVEYCPQGQMSVRTKVGVDLDGVVIWCCGHNGSSKMSDRPNLVYALERFVRIVQDVPSLRSV